MHPGGIRSVHALLIASVLTQALPLIWMGRAVLVLSVALITPTASRLQGKSEKLQLAVLQSSDAADLGPALVNPTLTPAQVTLIERS